MSLPELKHILLVEDDPDIQMVATLALETIGSFKVDVCSSGIEALETTQDITPDLILLDVMMPNMDGPQTLEALQARPETAQIPVIFMTAKVQTHEVKSYQALGAIEVIAKPFDPMTLADSIREIWKQHHTT